MIPEVKRLVDELRKVSDILHGDAAHGLSGLANEAATALERLSAQAERAEGALREPTHEMLCAGVAAATGKLSISGVEKVWEAMVRAALTKEPK